MRVLSLSFVGVIFPLVSHLSLDDMVRVDGRLYFLSIQCLQNEEIDPEVAVIVFVGLISH